MESLPVPIESNHPAWEALKEIQQARSNFQLEHFVVNQHDTPEQQYRQVLLELQELVFAIRKIDLEAKKTLLQIDRLRDSGDAIDEIEAQLKEIDLERVGLSRYGALKEVQTLLHIWEGFEHKFTAEEIEAGQVAYWDARLTRQAHLEAIGSQGSVAWGSLDALRQIGKLKLTEDTTDVDGAIKELK